MSAQAIPGMAQNQQSIDSLTTIQTMLANLLNVVIGPIQNEGMIELQGLGGIMLVYILLVSLFNGSMNVERLVEFIFLYLTAFSMLQFYDAPMPWGGGLSFHQIFSEEARWIEGQLDLTIVNNLTTQVNTIYATVEAPGLVNFAGWLAYMGLFLNLMLVSFLSFGITAVSYFAMACGVALGPLLIPFLVWPDMSWLFRGWLRFMIMYAMVRIMNAVAIYVYGQATMQFIANVLGGDYSTGHLLLIIGPFLALNFVGITMIFSPLILARDITSGMASASSPISALAKAVAVRI